MKEAKNIKKNYSIAKILAPLLSAHLIKKKDLKDLFLEVDKCVNDVLENSKLYKNLNENQKTEVSTELYELFSTMLSNELLNNNNSYLEETKEDVIYIFDKIPNFLTRLKIDNESFDKKIHIGMTYIIKDIYNFHNTLYLSDFLTLDEMRLFSLKFIKTALKSLSLLIDYITKENEEIKTETFKMAGYIYSVGLSSLFEYLSKNENKINDYIKNQDKYIKKIDKTFIENYTILAKTTKIITKQIKD